MWVQRLGGAWWLGRCLRGALPVGARMGLNLGLCPQRLIDYHHDCHRPFQTLPHICKCQQLRRGDVCDFRVVAALWEIDLSQWSAAVATLCSRSTVQQHSAADPLYTTGFGPNTCL